MSFADLICVSIIILVFPNGLADQVGE